MLSRYDLNENEQSHARVLGAFCSAAAQGDVLGALQCWPEKDVDLLSRRLALVRPAEQLEDFHCIFYGSEIQERFSVDFTGKTFGEIPELDEIRESLDAFRQVAMFKAPHMSRVMRDQRSEVGVKYTRILRPIIRRGTVTLVASLFVFFD